MPLLAITGAPCRQRCCRIEIAHEATGLSDDQRTGKEIP